MNDATAALPPMADLYGDIRGALLAFLRRQTGDADVAEDLLHDVVVKALAASLDDTTTPRNLIGWLYAVARNAAMDYHRRRRPTEAIDDDLAAASIDDESDAESEVLELANCLRPMADRLPATYRETIIAAEFDGLPLATVAQAQGLSLSAVKTRTSRGRKLLQAELVRCCRVSLSDTGHIVDFDAAAVAQCTAAQSGCAGSRSARCAQ